MYIITGCEKHRSACYDNAVQNLYREIYEELFSESVANNRNCSFDDLCCLFAYSQCTHKCAKSTAYFNELKCLLFKDDIYELLVKASVPNVIAFDKECTMNFETEKAWMVRSDGAAFPCICHIYGAHDDIEETMYAAEWLYQHTANEKTKELCLRLFKTYGVSLSEHRNCVRSILIKIKETPYRFLDYRFIYNISAEIQNAPTGILSSLNEQIVSTLNNEFMRVRYGGMYDLVEGNRDLYFRLSNNGLLTCEWKDIIRTVIDGHKEEIDEVFIVSDKESTGECKYLFLTDETNLDLL